MDITSAFWKLHQGLPRQGPGSDKTTRKLFRAAMKNGTLKTAIDMGCGPGKSAIWLASQGLTVTAIDTHEPFLEELRENATNLGVIDKIKIKNMSIDEVAYEDSSFDLVWSEGTAYLIGWEHALSSWKRLIKPGGRMVVTDCFWLTNNRSPEAIKFWEADPNMLHIKQAVAIAEKIGYVADFVYEQPDSDWFDEYYLPLEKNAQRIKDTSDINMRKVINDTNREIQIRRRHGKEYGHIGFVLRLK